MFICLFIDLLIYIFICIYNIRVHVHGWATLIARLHGPSLDSVDIIQMFALHWRAYFKGPPTASRLGQISWKNTGGTTAPKCYHLNNIPIGTGLMGT